MRRPISCLVAVLVSALLPATTAVAAIGSCIGTLSGVSVSPSGTVTIYYDGVGVLYMCNVSGTLSGAPVAADTCKAWVAQFTTAMVNRGHVTMNFDFGSAPAPACSYGFVGTWAIPNPFPYFVIATN